MSRQPTTDPQEFWHGRHCGRPRPARVRRPARPQDGQPRDPQAPRPGRDRRPGRGLRGRRVGPGGAVGRVQGGVAGHVPGPARGDPQPRHVRAGVRPPGPGGVRAVLHGLDGRRGRVGRRPAGRHRRQGPPPQLPAGVGQERHGPPGRRVRLPGGEQAGVRPGGRGREGERDRGDPQAAGVAGPGRGGGDDRRDRVPAGGRRGRGGRRRRLPAAGQAEASRPCWPRGRP